VVWAPALAAGWAEAPVAGWAQARAARWAATPEAVWTAALIVVRAPTPAAVSAAKAVGCQEVRVCNEARFCWTEVNG
jgi:hypothetical protein